MTDTAFASVIDLAAGALVLAAVLIVWRRDLRSIIRLLAGRVPRWPRSRSSAACTRATPASSWSASPCSCCAASCCRGCWPAPWAPNAAGSARPPRW